MDSNQYYYSAPGSHQYPQHNGYPNDPQAGYPTTQYSSQNIVYQQQPYQPQGPYQPQSQYQQAPYYTPSQPGAHYNPAATQPPYNNYQAPPLPPPSQPAYNPNSNIADTPIERFCDVCTHGIDPTKPFWHCSYCKNSDFDMCNECKEGNMHCFCGNEHLLEWHPGFRGDHVVTSQHQQQQIQTTADPVTTQEPTPAEAEAAALVAAQKQQLEQQQLQMVMKMNMQMAQMMAMSGASIASLV